MVFEGPYEFACNCCRPAEVCQGIEPCAGAARGIAARPSSAPRPGRYGYTTALLQEAGGVLLRKCYDIYPCTRLALQVGAWPGFSVC